MNWRTVTYLGVALSIFTGPGSLWAVQTGVWNSGMSILQFVVRSRSLVAARGVFVDYTPAHVLELPTGLGTDLLCVCWFGAVGGNRGQAGSALEAGVFPGDLQSS